MEKLEAMAEKSNGFMALSRVLAWTEHYYCFQLNVNDSRNILVNMGRLLLGRFIDNFESYGTSWTIRKLFIFKESYQECLWAGNDKRMDRKTATY